MSMRFNRLTEAEFFAKLATIRGVDTESVAARLASAPLGLSGCAVPGPHPTLTIGEHGGREGEASARLWIDVPDDAEILTPDPDPVPETAPDAG